MPRDDLVASCNPKYPAVDRQLVTFSSFYLNTGSKPSQKEGAQPTTQYHRSPSSPLQAQLLVTFGFPALWPLESAA